jgi:predicted permease
MGNLLQDLTYGLRMLRKDPGFTAVAILTLALGIGANSTIFSWINSTLLNPLPGVSRTGDLYALTSGGTAQSPHIFSYPDFSDLRNRTQSFSGIFASSIYPMDLAGDGNPERTWGTLVSANYFDVLNVRPILGRGFLPAEDEKPGGAPVAVISYRLWQSRFGGNPRVIGGQLNIDRHPYTIIGVAPALFQGNQTGLRSELWVPLTMEAQLLTQSDLLQRRDRNWLLVMGRVREGVRPEQARQELDLLMQQLVRQFPDAHQAGVHVGIYPLWRSPAGANAYFYLLLPMLMAIAGVVLLLACANVANLLLVRSVSRRREIAIRLSLGASRWRLVRQLFMESLLVAAAGGGLAMVITLWTASLFVRFIPPAGIPIGLDVHADRTVMLVTLAMSVITAIVFGVLPAVRSSGIAPVTVLKEESGSASGGIRKARLSTALVVAQLSLSLLLLVCAGLIIRGFREAQHFDPGFKPDHVLLATFNLFSSGYNEQQGLEFQRQLQTRLENLPGVKSVALAGWIPMGFGLSETPVLPEGYVAQPHEDMAVEDAAVSPGYFRTMEIRLISGRDFALADQPESQKVVIVNRTFAERYWPGQFAVGKRVQAGGVWRTVVGIAQTSDYDDLNEAPKPFVYLPLFQNYSSLAALHVRTSGDPLLAAGAVEKTTRALLPDLAIYDVTTLAARLQIATTGERIAGTFVGAFGVLALVLGAVGIYGVVAYITRQRTHEIGIRMALGAQRIHVMRLVLIHSLRLTGAGLAIGLALSLVLTRFIAPLMFNVSPTDPLTFVGVSLLLTSVAVAACVIPARRAMHVDPMVALRHE